MAIGPSMCDIDSDCRKLAADIQDILQGGLYLGHKDCHFIYSSMPIADIDEIEALIADPISNESDALIELIYFPDESIQIRLEDRIESVSFKQADEQTILEHLLTSQVKTTIRVAGRQKILTIQTPQLGLRAFLARLNITRHLDAGLIQVIDQSVDTHTGRKYKVWLRNMTMDLRERDTRFIKNLFLKMNPHQHPFDPIMSFSLRFLEETVTKADLLQALVEYKRSCLKHIHRYDQFESKHRNHNTETLMTLGIRTPYADKQALMSKVVLMDEISLALFDRSI
jgi:hypothetical protein